MTTKVNGAAYPGVWVEKQVSFIKITFSTDISALAAGSLYVLGTTTAVGSGTVADSTFAIVESAIVQALKTLETKCTVLGVSRYNSTDFSVDVMVGYAEGWFSDTAGSIATAQAVTSAQAVVTTAGAAPTNVLGELVSVRPSAVTFALDFAAFNGNMDIATGANGDLVNGPGATPGTNSLPTGTTGFYPVLLTAA